MGEHTETLDRELRRRLLQADEPLPRYDFIFPGRAGRLRHWLRGRVPLAVKIGIAELLGRLDRWRRPSELAEARVVTEAIVAGTRRAGELESIARRRLVSERVRESAFWRARWDRDHATGLDNMHAALDQGRGVIVSFCHLGSFQGSIGPLCTEGHRTTYIATNSWFLDRPDGSAWGVRIEHWRRGLARMDGRIVRMPGTFDTMRALLERGEVTMLAFDMPGRSETQFLGKRVMLTSGTAKLALRTDSLVLPMRRVRRGLRIVSEYGHPLDPRRHLNAQSLQAELAGIHEHWILDLPEALEDPRRPGAWEDGAGPSGWSCPAGDSA
ncbi:MAG TPA: hypothetical protein VGF74_14555 [Thermoleophilaceae bacterium]